MKGQLMPDPMSKLPLTRVSRSPPLQETEETQGQLEYPVHALQC